MYGAWSFLFLLAAVSCVAASEFPERECCDPEYPPALPTIPSTTVITSTDRSGPNLKTAIAILNCLLARQLCFEDPSCSAILEIIPRVCGPELVACSTVTVTKCQAALRTLQAFPFFKPTCLCREPHVDPECNSFRDFLFDHPCVFVLKKEKDPYPVDALPTCNHALSVCSQERKCIKLFEDFKLNCKVRDNKCRMEDRNLCHDSWANLRRSPMFGCICPNNNMKRRCDRIFSVVNHNPCVGKFMYLLSSKNRNPILLCSL
uniref:GDNF/GAS1 domain-containing protein n=1 Tax=Photinus pyralis TaxID=7054 RepID=A0A1Y1NLM4_PHOPY